MNEVIEIKKFGDINLGDVFFDSLKADYPGFEGWYEKKAKDGALAFVQYEGDALQAFLYLKDESGGLLDSNPPRQACRRLKVGTFKINPHNTRLGERFIKKILDIGVVRGYEEIYVTIYPKHEGLVNLLKRYGFDEVARKGSELVLVKDLKHTTGNHLHDYPMIDSAGRRKYLLSIYPEFHTGLFPDSILNNENGYELIKDVSHTNSIHKVYVSKIYSAQVLEPGDILVMYRTSDGNGPAEYRSVITSICQVEEVKTHEDFKSFDDFKKYALSYSVFDENILADYYKSQALTVIKMTYNIALSKRVTRGDLINNIGISRNQHFRFVPLTDTQFNAILVKGEINENFIVR